MRDTNNVIEKTIIEYFIRVTKEHGYYITFRSGVINSGLLGLLIPNTNKRVDNPLAMSRNINELAKNLEKVNDSIRRHSQNQSDKYENITMNISHLLHFFLESKGVGMEELCVIGEEIFNLTCGTLYGDDFAKDKPTDSIEKMNDPIQVKSKIFQDYVDGMRSGELNCSFEEYWNTRKPEVERWINAHNGSDDRNLTNTLLHSADMRNHRLDADDVRNRGFDDDDDAYEGANELYEEDYEPLEEDNAAYEDDREPLEEDDAYWDLPF